MDKYYHRGNGEVVKPEDPNPPKTGGYDPEWSEWKAAFVSTAPIYAYCDPSNPVGWIEGEEVYQVMPKKWAEKMNGIWTDCSKVIYDDYRKDNIFRRIWIEPRKQPDFHREAEELYPNTRSNGNDIYHNNDLADAQQEAHIKARQMSEQEIRELREENERLKAVIHQNYKSWHIQFYRATSDLTAREIDDMFKERYAKFKSENNL